MDHLTIRPQVTSVYTYWSEVDTEVSIYFPKDPVSSYRVSLDADAPDKYGATLGATASVRFDTGDLSPYATLNTGGRLGTFSTYTDTVVYATHRNVTRLEVGLYRQSPEAFSRLNSNWDAWERFKPDPEDLVKRWGLTGDVARNEDHLLRLELTDEKGDPLPPGLYYLELHECARDRSRVGSGTIARCASVCQVRAQRDAKADHGRDAGLGHGSGQRPAGFWLAGHPLLQRVPNWTPPVLRQGRPIV